MTQTDDSDEKWTPSRLSSSSASLYMQCPRQWKYNNVEWLRVGTTMAMLVGTFAHEVLEYLYQEQKQDRTIEAARKIAKDRWPEMEAEEDFIELQLTEDEVKEFKHRVWNNVGGVFLMEDPTKIDVVATEQKLVVEVDGVPYVGFVDRLDKEGDGVSVVDYKTGKPGQERFWPKKLEQVQLYAALVREQLDHTPTRVSLMFPSHQQSIDDNTDRRKQNKITRKLKGVWEDIHDSIENDKFPPSVGPLCAWCDFVGDCPEGTQEVHAAWSQGWLQKKENVPAEAILGLVRD